MSHSQRNTNYFNQLKDHKRFFIKRLGKRIIHSLSWFTASQSLVEDAPFVDTAHFPVLKTIQDDWQKIAEEARTILQFREEIPAFQEVSRDQRRIAKGKNWRTYILFGFGEKMVKNCSKTPHTSKLLEKVPNLQTAWFSILAPGYHIPAHTGVTKGILRAHLGLIIPKDEKNCRIRVGDQTQHWQPGSLFIIDDTYEHEVWNNTDEERVILLFDFDRPMTIWGRLINSFFLSAMKLTAFYQEPKQAMQTFEERFEAATKRNNDNFEKLSDSA